MDGFKAFQYNTALKLHFSSSKFNVFINRGRLRGSYQKFSTRNDRGLFDKVAIMYPNDRDCIRFLASNYMYGNNEPVYDTTEAVTLYNEYQRRRQSITKVFTDDLSTITNSGATYDFSRHQIPDVVQLYLSNVITLETIVILNDFDDIVSKIKQSDQLSLLISDQLLVIEKSKGFIKYDPYKIMGPYQQFLEDIKGNTNG